MLRGFFGNLIFAIIARMLCGNHLNCFDFESRKGDGITIVVRTTETESYTIFNKDEWRSPPKRTMQVHDVHQNAA